MTTFTPPAGTNLVHGLSPDFVNPLVHEGDVTFEKQLPKNMSFTAAYVVSRALHLPIFVDANLAPATTTKSYDITNLTGVTQSTITVPFYYGAASNHGVGDILTGFSDVNSWYNSMVLTVRKTMSHGFEFLANYTLSKAIDGGQVAGQFGTFFGTDPPIDPLNRKLEYGTSDLDQRHRFVGSAVWIPPFSKISQSARPATVGWIQLLDHRHGGDRPADDGVHQRFPFRRSGWRLDGRRGEQLRRLDRRTRSILPRNNFNLPNIYNIDFRIAREFAFPSG